eukprot:3531064-Rhodomonas_salina.5
MGTQARGPRQRALALRPRARASAPAASVQNRPLNPLQTRAQSRPLHASHQGQRVSLRHGPTARGHALGRYDTHDRHTLCLYLSAAHARHTLGQYRALPRRVCQNRTLCQYRTLRQYRRWYAMAVPDMVRYGSTGHGIGGACLVTARLLASRLLVAPYARSVPHPRSTVR